MPGLFDTMRMSGAVKQPWHETIIAAGQSSDLKLSLEAGHASCWPGSGQKWLDRSGGGYDFYRGIDGSAAGDDPSFNGSVDGQTAAEYWSFDGGDMFRYDSTSEAWMDAMHKAGARWSILMVAYIIRGGETNFLIGNGGTAGTYTGIDIQVTSAGRLVLEIQKGSTQLFLRGADAGAALTAGWHMIGVSVDDVAGTGFLWADAAYQPVSGADTWVPAYAGASTGPATYPMQMGAALNGGTQYYCPNGMRIGAVAAWQGRALSKAQMDAIHAGYWNWRY